MYFSTKTLQVFIILLQKCYSVVMDMPQEGMTTVNTNI